MRFERKAARIKTGNIYGIFNLRLVLKITQNPSLPLYLSLLHWEQKSISKRSLTVCILSWGYCASFITHILLSYITYIIINIITFFCMFIIKRTLRLSCIAFPLYCLTVTLTQQTKFKSTSHWIFTEISNWIFAFLSNSKLLCWPVLRDIKPNLCQNSTKQ